MAQVDTDAANAEQRRAVAVENADKHWADEAAREEAEHERRLEELIGIRTQQLYYANGWVMTEDECRQQAIAEIRGDAPDDRSAHETAGSCRHVPAWDRWTGWRSLQRAPD